LPTYEQTDQGGQKNMADPTYEITSNWYAEYLVREHTGEELPQ